MLQNQVKYYVIGKKIFPFIEFPKFFAFLNYHVHSNTFYLSVNTSLTNNAAYFTDKCDADSRLFEAYYNSKLWKN